MKSGRSGYRHMTLKSTCFESMKGDKGPKRLLLGKETGGEGKRLFELEARCPTLVQTFSALKDKWKLTSRQFQYVSQGRLTIIIMGRRCSFQHAKRPIFSVT